MRKTLAILRIISANLFLLAILAQPAHQLQHLAQQIEHQHEFHHEKNCKHAGHITENDHCKFCNFTFFPSDGFVVQHIEIPLEFEFPKSKQEFSASNFYHSELNSHKRLRAPPFNV
ncbi:MAG TPA: hypothetical protein VKY36_04865 [Moheibacter sp.]|nr:hypothetical protein [Moheibacter sp.]